MEILSSGSFINTDNQEKIEQLKFTALQLANATAERDGFAGGEEAGKKLGLEFWQGLEYMCRDVEEAAIKNIFLSHFLERLGELRPRENPAACDLPDDPKAKDEFLGVIAETSEGEDDETIIAEERKAIIEEGSRRTVDFPGLDNDSAENKERKPDDTVLSESKVELLETLTIETSKTDASNLGEKPKEEIVPEVFQLPEKEPYQFDKCTVTATIQLLPTDSEKRRAVLSVRTHDFAPQISVHEFTGETSSANLLSALDGAFEKYKTDLPVKVMDKLKKEKESVKKKSRKKSEKPETKEVAPKKPMDNKAVAEPEVKTGENVTPSLNIPKQEMSVQGSLFG
jgi:hypothetical protein